MTLKTKMLIDRMVGIFLIFWLNFAARLLGFVLRRDHDLNVKGDILVIKLLGGGSLVMAFPALLGLRRACPQHKMRLLTTKAVEPFAETLGVFDEILILNDDSLPGMMISVLACLKKSLSSDTVLDFEIYSYLSTIISLFTFARNRLGFFFDEGSFRQRLHTHRIFFHPSSPLYLHYDRMVEILGARIATMPDCAAHMLARLNIDAATLRSTPRIAIGCGCSYLSAERRLSAQQWSRHVFGATADRTREVIFLGSHADAQEATRILDEINRDKSWGGKMTNDCGSMPLYDSLRMLADCEEFWGIDSSLIHYARLFRLRIKAFYGPTNPEAILRPLAGLEETVYYRKTVCSPCVHLVSNPPCHGDNICMKGLFDDQRKDNDNVRWINAVTD